VRADGCARRDVVRVDFMDGLRARRRVCVRARSLACSVCARGFEWITARGWMMRVGEGCVRRARAKARVRGLGRTLERARGEARGVNAQFNATRLTMCCA